MFVGDLIKASSALLVMSIWSFFCLHGWTEWGLFCLGVALGAAVRYSVEEALCLLWSQDVKRFATAVGRNVALFLFYLLCSLSWFGKGERREDACLLFLWFLRVSCVRGVGFVL